MTDKAKELHELADELQWGVSLFWSTSSGREIIADALRLAVTLEEFGNLLGHNLFKDHVGRWHAPTNTFARSIGYSTPIEAMRAAIDAAKPCSHLFPKAGDGWVFLEDEGYWGRNCKRCGLLETADRLVPAKEGE